MRFLLVLIACLGWAQTSFAGGGSQQHLPPSYAPEDIARFSEKVERALAGHGAQVAIVARNGRPKEELPKGVQYTHVGFAVYSEIKRGDGTSERGYAFHNLYQSAENMSKSELVTDLTVDFFSGAAELKAGIIIPQVALQEQLYKVILGEQYKKLHNPQYSAIANPFDTRYQNCTEFVMNVTQSAIYDSSSLAEIKANLEKWFDTYQLPYSKSALSLASMMNDDISVEDQNYPFVTTTYSSIVNYMNKYNMATQVIELDDPDAKPVYQRVKSKWVFEVALER